MEHNTIEGILRARMIALFARHKVSATGVAKAMGRSHTWLLRKLDPARGDSRPLTLSDLADVLEHLAEPPEALLAPVLLPGDEQLLGFCLGHARPEAELAAVFNGYDRITQRLLGQGLIVLDDKLLITTTAGAALLA